MNSLASKRVLVTGATGFIGSRLVRHLVEEECKVRCLVRSTSRVDELLDLNVSLATCSFEEADAVKRTVLDFQPEIVFHVAGLVRSLDRRDFTTVNADAVSTIAEASAACDEPPVVVLVSSLAAAGPSVNEQPRTEHDEPAPVSVYGRSKLAGERAALQFADRVPITIVRPPIVFGPGDQGVLQLMRPIARRGVHLVPGRGDFRISLIYVDDLVHGICRAARNGERATIHSTPGSGIYFIASDEHPTYETFGHLLAGALQCKHLRVLHAPAAGLRLAGRVADIAGRLRGRPTWINSDKVREALAGSWICDSSKAQLHLGWSAQAPLADRLETTVQAHREAGWL